MIVLYKQQKISKFFTKLTQEEGVEQATRHLVKSADVREEWVEKEEVREMAKKTSRKADNTRLQQECRVRRKEREVQSGMRGLDGKIKKVMNSERLLVIVQLLIHKLEMEISHATTTNPPSQNNGADRSLTSEIPDHFQSHREVEEFCWHKTQTRATRSEEDHELVPPINLGAD